MKFTDYYKKTANDNNDFEFEVSYSITELRLRFGLTQKELAKKIGTKQPSIARMESGVELPSLRILKKIADSLNVNLIPPKFDFVGTTKSCEKIITSTFTVKSWPVITPQSTDSESTAQILLANPK